MKPAPFEYACPTSLDEAVALLSSNDEAKVISGGQSLMPLMNFRLAAPSLLVDLRKLDMLRQVRIDDDGVEIGARVRWCDIERDEKLKAAFPLLHAMIAHVAHYQVRNRGTVGGSLAHADPAAEMPGFAVTCDAVLKLVGASGTREVAAADFFEGPLMTVLEQDEIIVGVRLPAWQPGRRWGFREFARRRGDFALSGVAAYYDPDAQGLARNVHIGVIGACPTPQRLPSVEAVIEGRKLDDEVIAEAGREIAAAVEPSDDLHATAAYRRGLCETLLTRVLADMNARQGS